MPQVQKKTVEACRSYLELPHFNSDVIYNKSHAAAGLCNWAINIVKYYDVVSEVRRLRPTACTCLAAWRTHPPTIHIPSHTPSPPIFY